MPTWCHMFNSTLTGNARVWFDKLPKESIDSYEDLRAAFRENYLQQRNGESTEDFMERYKAEVLDVEGAPECMKISGFMHGITHPEFIKRLYEKIPRSMDEMYKVTTSFLQGEVAAFSYSRKKAPAPWRFSLLTKTPKEIFALEKGKFKAPPPMLRKQIDEMIKSGKLSQFIKELKQIDKPKTQKKGETARKDKPLAILMIQPWERGRKIGNGYLRKGQKRSQNGQNRAQNGKEHDEPKSKVNPDKVKVKGGADIKEMLNGPTRTYLMGRPPKNNDQRAFIGGAWSDNGEDEVEKTKDETCLVAQAPDEICLGVNLEPLWSGC
ncbi:reverse transcriptase domain-containing protein [Tanacetum coccineum]|uniref:Reverse transcriptase domain-containing protein n=1 Tax=Tanacetum coccineum TaxID=301880 RepID=A0ABQ5DRE6_9ASTR